MVFDGLTFIVEHLRSAVKDEEDDDGAAVARKLQAGFDAERAVEASALESDAALARRLEQNGSPSRALSLSRDSAAAAAVDSDAALARQLAAEEEADAIVVSARKAKKTDEYGLPLRDNQPPPLPADASVAQRLSPLRENGGVLGEGKTFVDDLYCQHRRLAAGQKTTRISEELHRHLAETYGAEKVGDISASASACQLCARDRKENDRIKAKRA